MAEFKLRAGQKSFGLGTGDGNFGLRDRDDALRRKVQEAVERRELEKTAKMVGQQVTPKDKAELERAKELRAEKVWSFDRPTHLLKSYLGLGDLAGFPTLQAHHHQEDRMSGIVLSVLFVGGSGAYRVRSDILGAG